MVDVTSWSKSSHEELHMEQRSAFSETLNELKKMKKQLYSAADYFESSYKKDDQKQIVVETLKDYTVKAFINIVDHLGSIADKVNRCMDEQIVQASTTDLPISCLDQRLRRCQCSMDRNSLFQQSLALSFPQYHKRYIIEVGDTTATAVNQSSLEYHKAEEDLFQFTTASNEISPIIISNGSSSPSTQSPKSSPKSFQFKRMVAKSEREKREVSPRRLPVMLRSGSLVNAHSLKQRYPREARRSVSMCVQPDRGRNKSPERHPGFNKRLLKALISMRKNRSAATFQ